jgi:archaeosine-15-forming tRNA-guanine transglycosylase
MTAFMNAIQTGIQCVAGYVYTAGEAVVVGTKNVLVTTGDGIIAVGKAVLLGVGIGG